MRKRKYDAELIIKIVKGHIEEGLSSSQLSVQYNIHRGIIEECRHGRSIGKTDRKRKRKHHL